MITRRTLDLGRFDVDQWVLGMTEHIVMLSIEVMAEFGLHSFCIHIRGFRSIEPGYLDEPECIMLL